MTENTLQLRIKPVYLLLNKLTFRALVLLFFTVILLKKTLSMSTVSMKRFLLVVKYSQSLIS